MGLTEPIRVGLLEGLWGLNFPCEMLGMAGESAIPFSVTKTVFFLG